MKHIILLISVVLLMTSCTIYIPHETETEVPDAYRLNLILNIQPEDTKVVVNGRFIGEAYEFSTERTALRISRMDTQVVLKREGYREEPINIRRYASGTARVNLDMRPNPNRPYPPLKKEAKPPLPEKKEIPEAEEQEAEKEEKEMQKKAPEIFVYTLSIKPEASAIYIDGKFWGTSPAGDTVINNLRLKAGPHKVHVFKPGYKSYTKKFIASAKSNKKIVINLKKETR